jgi:Icc-related predicted phosphoesterase
VVAILGNHDYHRNKESDIRAVLTDVGVTMLEGNTVTFNVRGHSVGIAGVKGFGGGFGSGFCPEFGEPETKAFALAGKRQAQIIRDLLRSLNTDYKFALLHYAPVEHTLLGERREIYPFLGSYLLGEAIDQAGANAVFHGHAHYGTERGNTHGGIPVRNVAQMVIKHAYHVYSFDAAGLS